MTYRLAKKRTLEKAGFAHVSGWVSKDEAAQIKEQIEAAKPKVAEVIKYEN